MLAQGNSKKNNPDRKIEGIFPAEFAGEYGIFRWEMDIGGDQKMPYFCRPLTS